MNQRRGLECVPGRFVGHPMRRQFAQFFIDQREQLVGGIGIALLDGAQDSSDVAHVRNDIRLRWWCERIAV